MKSSVLFLAVLRLLCHLGNAELLVQVYDNLAFSGNATYEKARDFSDVERCSWCSVRFQASIVPLEQTFIRFGLSGDAGFVRLWIDHHLMVEGWLDASNSMLASYALPVPFVPRNASLLQLELTIHDRGPSTLILTHNASHPASTFLFAEIPFTEDLYLRKRAEHEVGWNTWLSTDMLAHVLLPHGIAVSLSIGDVSNVGGPSCDASVFPIRHGIKSLFGEYSEIEEIRNGDNIHRMESATFGTSGIVIRISAVKILSAMPMQVTYHVPADYAPRYCSFEKSLASCPGFAAVRLNVMTSMEWSLSATNTSTTISLESSKEDADPIYVIAYIEDRDVPPTTRRAADSVIDQGRTQFIEQLGSNDNETKLGLVSSIAWNKIYAPHEGIITPIIRGRPWSVSQPNAYVLFEWDTYLASIMATYLGDIWTATSNMIRMTHSLWYQGFVPGFWNGACGELDKSKPPLGALAVENMVKRHPQEEWIAHYLLPYFVEWNSWWAKARMPDAIGLISPGSTRRNIDSNLTINCDNFPPLFAAACETGLDNSPLYETSTFVVETDTIDHWDVGMTSFVVRDSQAIAFLAALVGDKELSATFAHQQSLYAKQLHNELWNDEVGIYLNKKWTTKGWIAKDGKTNSFVIAPTSFYPMLSGIPDDVQVERMMTRYLTNSSEFQVNADFKFGIPSISRSSSHFHDNSYWRGRIWGPLNYLVFVGLEEYSHLSVVRHAMEDLARQSKATFLEEWTTNRRIMENYNNENGAGCDVRDASPFYHWGALNALVALIHNEKKTDTMSMAEVTMDSINSIS